jgi:hypothetical protein
VWQLATNVFDLFAKISLDSSGYEKGLKDAGSKFSEFGEGLKNAAGKIGDVLLGIGKAATAGVAAAGTALTALTKQSLDSYAEFEQLEGGTKLMFGEGYNYIIEKSKDAYKTVQLSQNEYLQQVNGFAVGLKTALNGNEQAAAELADKIVRAEADIVAATGNTQEMVQNAFNGIMRTNYTMLDNLGLGIKPTKEGMEEVIAKVNEWNAANGKATEYVIDNLADVQSALVDYIEMQDMAGYASMEAGSTITGSIAGVKAAWKDFISGNGNVQNFVDMFVPTAKNIITKLNTIIPNLTEGLLQIADALAPEIPPIIEAVLPAIINGASNLLTGLAERLPDLISILLPSVSQGIIDVSTALVTVLPSLITSLKETIPIILTAIWEKKDQLFEAGKEIISSLIPSDEEIEKLPNLVTGAAKTVIEFAANLTNPENLKKVIDKGFEIINALIDGLTSDETLDQFFDPDTGVIKVIENLSDALVHFVFKLTDAATKIIKNLGDYLNDEENRKQLYEAAKQIMIKIAYGLNSQEAREAIGGIIVVAAQFLISTFIGGVDWNASGAEIAKRVVIGFYNNITAIPQWIGEKAYDITHKPIAGESGGHYAKGGVFTRPTYGLIGEDGAEVVMPLEKNTEWIDKLADRINNRGSSVGISIGEINVTVSGEENADKIGEKVVRSIDEALKQYQITQNRGVGAVSW